MKYHASTEQKLSPTILSWHFSQLPCKICEGESLCPDEIAVVRRTLLAASLMMTMASRRRVCAQGPAGTVRELVSWPNRGGLAVKNWAIVTWVREIVTWVRETA